MHAATNRTSQILTIQNLGIVIFASLCMYSLTIHHVYAPCIDGIPCGDLRPIPSPLKQLELGTESKHVLCHDNFVLVFKALDGSPACVRPETREKLIARGWATN